MHLVWREARACLSCPLPSIAGAAATDDAIADACAESASIDAIVQILQLQAPHQMSLSTTELTI